MARCKPSAVYLLMPYPWAAPLSTEKVRGRPCGLLQNRGEESVVSAESVKDWYEKRCAELNRPTISSRFGHEILCVCLLCELGRDARPRLMCSAGSKSSQSSRVRKR